MGKLVCSTTNSYLQQLRYYQQLQLDGTEFRNVVGITKEFTRILNTKYGATLMPNSKESSNLKENFLRIGNCKLEKQYWDLRRYLNAGNLKYVVFALYTEEGLTAKEFGEKINYTGKDIIEFMREDLITYKLLDAICEYFGILKTSDFVRYIN